MPVKEFIGKVITFSVVAAALIVGGFLVLTGAHASNDYLNGFLGWTLVALGLLTGAYGVFSLGGIYYEARLRRRESELHITPRVGPPTAPPPWGMGDVGRPSVVEVGGDVPSGGGGTRVMSVVVSNLDAPLVIGLLLVWTLVALIFLAPK